MWQSAGVCGFPGNQENSSRNFWYILEETRRADICYLHAEMKGGPVLEPKLGTHRYFVLAQLRTCGFSFAISN